MRARRHIFLVSILLLGAVHAGVDPWVQLKAGLLPAATTALVGPPLLSCHGHGFETWFYANGGEAIFRNGGLFGWTAPVSPTPLAVELKRPAKKPSGPASASPPPSAVPETRLPTVAGKSAPPPPPPSKDKSEILSFFTPGSP